MTGHGLSNLPTSACASCQAKDAVIAELVNLLQMSPLRRSMAMPKQPNERMMNCPCRPENGGSGVCGCVLSGPRVTCSTGTAS